MQCKDFKDNALHGSLFSTSKYYISNSVGHTPHTYLAYLVSHGSVYFFLMKILPSLLKYNEDGAFLDQGHVDELASGDAMFIIKRENIRLLTRSQRSSVKA